MVILLRVYWILFTALIGFKLCLSKLRNSTELTRMLQEVMKNYDKRIVPTKDGEPTVVNLQMYIGDMVPVENIHMHYSMDLYLREFWYDYRLELPLEDGEQFPLNGMFIDSIWTPDIYFPLGKKGQLHEITRPNSLIRIFKNGLVRSSQRVSITSFCPMNLANFPFDIQLCKFYLEPYSYNNQQCKLKWSYDRGGPIFHPKDLRMYEFTLHKIAHTNVTSNYGIFGMYDSLVVEFHLRRNINYYLLQNYIPTSLIVFLSWVGFWIDYRSTPARVALGITTVLTITTLANSIRATLPPVSYSKSIDYYLLACFLFVFAALVEFAVVGITDIKWKNLTKAEKREMKRQIELENRTEETKGNDGRAQSRRSAKSRLEALSASLSSIRNNDDRVNRVTSRSNEAFVVECSSSPARSRANSARIQNNWTEEDTVPENADDIGVDENEAVDKENENAGISFSFTAIVKAKQLARKLAEKHQREGEIHMIDKLCRILFPFSFILFNIIYFAIVATKEE